MRKWFITSESELYSILQCNEERINVALAQKEEYYGKPIEIRKKKGVRKIYAIKPGYLLYDVQKNLLNNFLKNIKVSPLACGFVKKSCYFDFLEPHIDFYKNSNYLRLDIKNFFDSINEEMIKDAFDYYCDMEDEDEKNNVLTTLAAILTYENRVVQGTITAPTVSNIVFRRLDIRIERYCSKYSVQYTRYADDLLFSSESDILHKKSFAKGISKILGSEGFLINYDKVIRSKSYISLNGFVVSNRVTLSRKKLGEINRVLFYLKRKEHLKEIKDGDVTGLNLKFEQETSIKIERFVGKYDLINYLNGYRAFLISIIKKNENKNLERIVKEIEKDVEYLLKE